MKRNPNENYSLVNGYIVDSTGKKISSQGTLKFDYLFQGLKNKGKLILGVVVDTKMDGDVVGYYYSYDLKKDAFEIIIRKYDLWPLMSFVTKRMIETKDYFIFYYDNREYEYEKYMGAICVFDKNFKLLYDKTFTETSGFPFLTKDSGAKVEGFLVVNEKPIHKLSKVVKKEELNATDYAMIYFIEYHNKKGLKMLNTRNNGLTLGGNSYYSTNYSFVEKKNMIAIYNKTHIGIYDKSNYSLVDNFKIETKFLNRLEDATITGFSHVGNATTVTFSNKVTLKVQNDTNYGYIQTLS